VLKPLETPEFPKGDRGAIKEIVNISTFQSGLKYFKCETSVSKI
jgi:hypothetical protein